MTILTKNGDEMVAKANIDTDTTTDRRIEIAEKRTATDASADRSMIDIITMTSIDQSDGGARSERPWQRQETTTKTILWRKRL